MSVRKTTITVASAACIAMVLPCVKKSEGYWPTVKVDTVGTGRPCTGGYGETEGVKCGETHNEKYWSDRLQMRLADEYDREIGKCIHVDLPDSARAAMITTAYNAGSAAVCKSPMVAKMNAGDVRGGCEALLTSHIVNGERVYTGWYIRAQGRVVRGLINRRASDKKMCLEGLTESKRAVVAPLPQPRPVAAPVAKKAWWQK
jgi:lysozyme